MVAERRLSNGVSASMEDGTLRAMAGGQLVYFPGWEALRDMEATKWKEWLLSHENMQSPQYLSVVNNSVGSHRGPDISPTGPARPVRG